MCTDSSEYLPMVCMVQHPPYPDDVSDHKPVWHQSKKCTQVVNNILVIVNRIPGVCDVILILSEMGITESLDHHINLSCFTPLQSLSATHPTHNQSPNQNNNASHKITTCYNVSSPSLLPQCTKIFKLKRSSKKMLLWFYSMLLFYKDNSTKMFWDQSMCSYLFHPGKI